MASHAYKMHDVEKKCFCSYTEVSVLKKGFLNCINNIPYHRGTKTHSPCHVTSPIMYTKDLYCQ